MTENALIKRINRVLGSHDPYGSTLRKARGHSWCYLGSYFIQDNNSSVILFPGIEDLEQLEVEVLEKAQADPKRWPI